MSSLTISSTVWLSSWQATWVTPFPGLQEGGEVFSQGKPWLAPGQTSNILSVLTHTGKGKGLLAGWLGTWSCWNFFLGVLRTAARAELNIRGAKLAEQKQLHPQNVVLA